MSGTSILEDIEIPEGLRFSHLKVRWNLRRDDIDYDRGTMRLIALHNGLDPEVVLGRSRRARTCAALIIGIWYSMQRRAGGERDPIFEQIFAEVEAWEQYGPTRVQRSFGSIH